MVRSYHLTDYDWTPLSRNHSWKATTHSCHTGDGHSQKAVGLLLEPIFDFTRARQAPLPSWCVVLFERWGTKSFANDLSEDRDVVITRAVFSLRCVENKPQDLSICPSGARARNIGFKAAPVSSLRRPLSPTYFVMIANKCSDETKAHCVLILSRHTKHQINECILQETPLVIIDNRQLPTSWKLWPGLLESLFLPDFLGVEGSEC